MINLPTMRFTFETEDKKEADVYPRQWMKKWNKNKRGGYLDCFGQHAGYYSVLRRSGLRNVWRDDTGWVESLSATGAICSSSKLPKASSSVQ